MVVENGRWWYDKTTWVGLHRKWDTCNIKGKSKVCIWAKWPIRPELILVSLAWSDWEYSYSPLDAHLYTCVERGTVRVKCPAQKHNTMSPARARTRTRTTRSGDERTNHPWGQRASHITYTGLIIQYVISGVINDNPGWITITVLNVEHGAAMTREKISGFIGKLLIMLHVRKFYFLTETFMPLTEFGK